jgi:hypothetical protein
MDKFTNIHTEYVKRKINYKQQRNSSTLRLISIMEEHTMSNSGSPVLSIQQLLTILHRIGAVYKISQVYSRYKEQKVGN